jgi:four helix bundle protein
MEAGKWKLENGSFKTGGHDAWLRHRRHLAAQSGTLRIWKYGGPPGDSGRRSIAWPGRFRIVQKFGLASQLRRAAISVTANLAQGFGRFGYQENAQLGKQARGSLYEVRDHLTTSVDEGYLEQTEGERLEKLAQTMTRFLNGYLRSTPARKRDER